MHRGHDHNHAHDHAGHAGHAGHGHRHHTPPGAIGHNAPGARTAQWQTPHRSDQPAPSEPDALEADLDLVEASFVEGFARASDVVSFLRLAGIPFFGEAGDGRRLHLLRVETEDTVDVGAVMPLVGGAGVRCEPLPAKMTSRRRRLGFVYHDGVEPVRLDFAGARALAHRSEAAPLPHSAS